MKAHLHKINHRQNEHRFYAMEVAPDLFGHWLHIREWGRIGSSGGQRRIDSHGTLSDALEAFTQLKVEKEGRGYVVQPELMALELFPAE